MQENEAFTMDTWSQIGCVLFYKIHKEQYKERDVFFFMHLGCYQLGMFQNTICVSYGISIEQTAISPKVLTVQT